MAQEQQNWTAPDLSSRHIAVLGGGVLGRRIACSWIAAGYNVVLCDLDAGQRNAAKEYTTHHIGEYNKVTGLQRSPGELNVVAEMEAAVKNAGIVIEALPEKLPLKISILGQLDQAAPRDCILATNSSSYKSSEMIEKVSPARRQLVCNTHYYMPPGNNTVEIMTCGETNTAVLEFLREKLEDAGMTTAIARKESTGLIFNRLWAAIKRETLLILAEGVSEPEEIDKLFVTMFKNSPSGPCGLMDAVGLDTVAFIEDHYVQERKIDSTSRDWLRTNYVEKGKLGAKSGKGGLYPPGATTRASKDESSHHDNLAAPRLYFLDIGLGGEGEDIKSLMTAGKILTASADGSNVREIVTGQSLPDGIDVSIEAGKIFWTNMGTAANQNNGSVMSADLDGKEIRPVIPEGKIHTPKQIKIDHKNQKLYISDREGMRVHRCKFDGSDHEIIVQTGDGTTNGLEDQRKWCVGIAIDPSAGKFYWTQKGPSKAGQGRIFCANIDMPEGETASTRSDIELVFDNLPEPIDLDFDADSKTLYWTDRGEHPMGNTLNSANVGGNERKIKTLARHFREAIGLAIDKTNQHIYLTDLGGTVYRMTLDGSDKKKIYDTDSAYSGIALTYMHSTGDSISAP